MNVPFLQDTDTEYWANFADMQTTYDMSAVSVIKAGRVHGLSFGDAMVHSALRASLLLVSGSAPAQELQGLDLSWIDSWLSGYNITLSSNVSGRYYQLKSQIPGQGPCYPVWLATTEYFHR